VSLKGGGRVNLFVVWTILDRTKGGKMRETMGEGDIVCAFSQNME